MDGYLQLASDRGMIIGRAVWKARYVVVGSQNKLSAAPGVTRSSASGRAVVNRSSKVPSLADVTHLSIYKSKDEDEPQCQYPISLITDARVQRVVHRKQGPLLPTLIVNMAPDPLSEKMRKRRSSRTGGLGSFRDSGPVALWFRQVQDEEHTLGDWARFLHQLMQTNQHGALPVSPVTPATPNFANPFQRQRDMSEIQQRPSSSSCNPCPRRDSQETPPAQDSAARVRERPVTFSETISLRPTRSDLSAAMASSHAGSQACLALRQADLPSPATTVGEYGGEFIEGWTSAQGRLSALSSPARGRDSCESEVPVSTHLTLEAGSPSNPRETILDRAFQMRYVPGSERQSAGLEKLSSLARFDLLMREADEKRMLGKQEKARWRLRADTADPTPMKWTRDLGEDGLPEDEDADGDSAKYKETLCLALTPTTQWALDLIQEKKTAQTCSDNTHDEALTALPISASPPSNRQQASPANKPPRSGRCWREASQSSTELEDSPIGPCRDPMLEFPRPQLWRPTNKPQTGESQSHRSGTATADKQHMSMSTSVRRLSDLSRRLQ